MKKVMLITATLFMFAAVSCEKKPVDDPNGQKTEVTTAKDALVVYLSMESNTAAINTGAGISFGNLAGKAAFQKGFIGNGYVNTGGLNTQEAYLKFNLAANNAFTKLESMTFSAWVKIPTGAAEKSGIISLNGTGKETIWPPFVFLFDNYDKDNGLWFNGRVDFLTVADKPILWPNSVSMDYAKKDTWFQIARTYDAATGAWANYCNGVKVGDGSFLIAEKPVGAIKAGVASDCNAMYVGGWATRIEGKSLDDWQGFFPGSIDELRIYNKALSETEINALYKEELAISLDQE